MLPYRCSRPRWLCQKDSKDQSDSLQSQTPILKIRGVKPKRCEMKKVIWSETSLLSGWVKASWTPWERFRCECLTPAVRGIFLDLDQRIRQHLISTNEGKPLGRMMFISPLEFLMCAKDHWIFVTPHKKTFPNAGLHGPFNSPLSKRKYFKHLHSHAVRHVYLCLLWF